MSVCGSLFVCVCFPLVLSPVLVGLVHSAVLFDFGGHGVSKIAYRYLQCGDVPRMHRLPKRVALALALATGTGTGPNTGTARVLIFG